MNFKYVRLFLALLFFFSGLSSLVYQVIWTRSLVFVFGSTQFATSTVLSVFMAGLALGSFIAGKYSIQKKIKPVLAYGILEGFIGIWALFAPLLFTLSIPLYQALFQQFHPNPLIFGLLRYLVAAIILLPPTTCMGATLPILSKYITEKIEMAGQRVGTLYAVNTLGAVVGSLGAGFFLMPNLGLSTTTAIAAAINLLLAVAAFFLIRLIKDGELSADVQNPRQENVEESQTPELETNQLTVEIWAVIWVFFISGGLAMFYEVAWTRTLLMLIGSTTYAFTLMLSTFLLGIFLGSIVCSRFVDKLKSPTTCFAIAEIYLCFAGLFSLSIFSFLPYWNVVISVSFSSNEALTMILRFAAAAMVLLPITLCLGAIFPLAVKICARDLDRIGDSVGKLYAMNTCGAIIGAFIAGFFAIPLLGCEQSLIVASLANFIVGVALLVAFGKIRKSVKVLSVICAALLTVWAIGGPSILDRNVLLFAQYERRLANWILGSQSLPTWDEWKKQMRKNILFYKDGLCATVAVSRGSTAGSTLLFTSGHCDASDGIDMENQALLAMLPLALKPDARDAAIVGWGSGVTVGYALKFNLRKAVCAEIEPAVIDASKNFHHVNFQAEKDPRCEIEPSDGRNFLLCTPEKFDIVVSEPSNPWQSGVCNLFTKEYFAITKSRLTDGGIFSMWCQLNEVSPKNLEEIISALSSVYPKVYLFDSGRGDMCALASAKPIKISLPALEKLFSSSGVAATFHKLGLKTRYDYVARMIACPQGIEKNISSKNINTDDRNHLEFELAKTYENRNYPEEDHAWLASIAGPLWSDIDYGDVSDEQKAEMMAQIGISCLGRDARRGLLWLRESMKVAPNAVALAALVEAEILGGDAKEADDLLHLAEQKFPLDARFSNLRGVKAVAERKYTEGRRFFNLAIAQDPRKMLYRLRLAQTHSRSAHGAQRGDAMSGADLNSPAVISAAEPILQDAEFIKQHPETLLILCDAYLESGQTEKANQVLAKAVGLMPSSGAIWQRLGRVNSILKNWPRAEYCFVRARRLNKDHFSTLLEQARSTMHSNPEGTLSSIKTYLDLCPGDEEALLLLAKLSETYKPAAVFFDQQKDIASH